MNNFILFTYPFFVGYFSYGLWRFLTRKTRKVKRSPMPFYPLLKVMELTFHTGSDIAMFNISEKRGLELQREIESISQLHPSNTNAQTMEEAFTHLPKSIEEWNFLLFCFGVKCGSQQAEKHFIEQHLPQVAIAAGEGVKIRRAKRIRKVAIN